MLSCYFVDLTLEGKILPQMNVDYPNIKVPSMIFVNLRQAQSCKLCTFSWLVSQFLTVWDNEWPFRPNAL